MGMNSGYSGWSMSNRACNAYENGEKPKSKWTKAEMLKALEETASELGVELPGQLKKLKKETLFKHLFYRSSWHHTSIHCNETDFYSIDTDALEELTAEQVDCWLAEDKVARSATKETEPTQFVCIKFTEWIGEGRRKKPVEQCGWGELKGDWCHLIEPSRNNCKKKNVWKGNCKIVEKFNTKEEMIVDAKKYLY